LGTFFVEARKRFCDGHGTKVFSAAQSHSHRIRRDLTVPHYQHIRDLLQLGLADLVIEVLPPGV
jgi:hypothetical protein